jgi:uncharacterized membrane protein (UPF0127 family)
MNARAVGVLALLVAALGGCGGEASDVFPPHAVVRVKGGGVDREIEVEIAATAEARRRGLMHRRRLPPDRGMLFLYREVGPQAFWMKNCHVPIDAAYVDEEDRIVNVVEMVPEPGVDWPRTYPSTAPVRIVLEMPGGWFRENGIGAGDRVLVPPELRALSPEKN